jgi:hypothetical protein
MSEAAVDSLVLDLVEWVGRTSGHMQRRWTRGARRARG